MKTLIALVQKMEQLRPSDFNAPEIRIVIAELGDDGKPRNFNRAFDEDKKSTGGCWAYCFAAQMSDSVSVLWNHYGPEISYGDLIHYQHAARAMELIQKRMDKMTTTRGSTNDAAEMVGRWLEACAVTKVFMRPEHSRKQDWHHKGDWNELTIGQLVSECRQHYPKPATEQAATVAA